VCAHRTHLQEKRNVGPTVGAGYARTKIRTISFAPTPRNTHIYSRGILDILTCRRDHVASRMKKHLTALALLIAAGTTGCSLINGPLADPVTQTSGIELQVEPIATNLDTIWDMVWAPDGEMWVTERPGRVSRINVMTGQVTPVGEIAVHEQGESGLMGMAFHPDFPAEPWVYLTHSFEDGRGIQNRLVRVRYENGRLGPAETLLDDVLGRTNHDGSRLLIGPDQMLYMTMGDAGQRPLAQNRVSINGKILRLTLDGQAAGGNPFGNEIWSWGHRNPQGLVFHPETGILYSSEHGPNTDDEINVIERGRNYGWPMVAGYCDAFSEEAFCQENEIVEPIQAWTPTVGISGADFYNHDLIPGWKGSLLVTSLVGRSLFRVGLSPDGLTVTTVEKLFEGQYGRLRDVLVGPDGAVYVATSNLDGRAGRIGPFEGDDRVLRITP
jgi:glucose/arabinose dehydrogenase